MSGTDESHRRRHRRPPAPAERVTHQPELDDTLSELLRLPPRRRAVVVLRSYEDMALTDIARLLDRLAATVRSDLHRALGTLRAWDDAVWELADAVAEGGTVDNGAGPMPATGFAAAAVCG